MMDWRFSRSFVADIDFLPTATASPSNHSPITRPLQPENNG